MPRSFMTSSRSGPRACQAAKPTVRKVRPLQYVRDLGKYTVCVNVHCGGPLGADVDLATGCLSERPCNRRKENGACRPACRLQKISAICHGELLLGIRRDQRLPGTATADLICIRAYG